MEDRQTRRSELNHRDGKGKLCVHQLVMNEQVSHVIAIDVADTIQPVN